MLPFGARTTLIAFAAMLGAGCAEDPSAPLNSPIEDAGALELVLPNVAGVRPEVTSRRILDRPPEGSRPARVTSDYEDDLSRPLQQIFDPRTRTRIEGGDGYALGIHDYIGNVGGIQTTVQVAVGDQYLGAFTAERQDYTPFLFDWGLVKKIWAEARVSLSRTCGVEVLGSSRHTAFWQMFQGRSAPLWGVAIKTSQADETTQGGCANDATGTRTESGSEPGGVICFYKITFVIGTGEIVGVELLSCTSSGDEKW
jgi:hypothetical protein